MPEQEWLADRFEENRGHLRAVAYRMLGTLNEADDAVQEAWVRLSRTDTSDVANLTGWLTTVVARVCLDMLRARKSRRESRMNYLNTWTRPSAALAQPIHVHARLYTRRALGGDRHYRHPARRGLDQLPADRPRVSGRWRRVRSRTRSSRLAFNAISAAGQSAAGNPYRSVRALQVAKSSRP